MEYVWFALLASLCAALNTILNRVSSNKVSFILSSALKSGFMIIFCFLICMVLGHIKNLYALEPEQWLFVILTGALTTCNWLFYFLAIKHSHLESFSPYIESSTLFFSNTLFMIFMFSVVVNVNSGLSIFFYILGLVLMFGSLIYITFNKKINPKTSKMWIVYASISALALAITVLLVKLKLTMVDSDIIMFHQMSIVFVVSVILCFITKQKKEFKKLVWQDYARFLLGAIFNTGLTIFRYRALSYDNCNPALVSVIISLEFVAVSVATIIFFKEKNKLQMSLLIALVSAGMLFNFLSTLV